MGKKIIVILLALLALNMASAQVLYLDTELSTHFDNTEHKPEHIYLLHMGTK